VRIVYLADHGSVHTRRWVGWFADRGHEVHVVTCGGSDARDIDHDGNQIPINYDVHDLGRPRFGKLGYFLKLRRARRIVRSLDADLVHVHWLTSYGLLALASGAEPLVATAHGDDVLFAPRKTFLKRIVLAVLRKAHLVTVPSEVMREAALELLANDETEIAVFQYGIDAGRLAALGDSYARRTDGSIRIASTRALHDLYRIEVLVDAVALLAKRGIDVHCDLVGDGPCREALEAQARALGISDRCTFHGHIPASQVEKIVAESDIYVSVSISDGVSLSLLEALAIGSVPVLSDIAANRPWVNDGVTGALVAIDPESVADGIERAAQLDRDRVIHDNRAVVSERADRDTNLAACEQMLDAIAGVRWDPRPAKSADAA
jgi:glycosyltransferase involved in cell wall biosynthesis